MENKCATCNGPAEGYKCDMCGEESMAHDDTHDCGGDYSVAKCKPCDEAETSCAC